MNFNPNIPFLCGVLACCWLVAACNQPPAPLAEIVEVSAAAPVEPDPNHPYVQLHELMKEEDQNVILIGRRYENEEERMAAQAPVIARMIDLVEQGNRDGKSLSELGHSFKVGEGVPIPHTMTIVAVNLPGVSAVGDAEFVRQFKAMLEFSNLNRSTSSQIENLSVPFMIDSILARHALANFSELNRESLAKLKPLLFSAANRSLATLEKPQDMAQAERESLSMWVMEYRDDGYQGASQNEVERRAAEALRRIDLLESRLISLQQKPTWDWGIFDMDEQQEDQTPKALFSGYGDQEFFFGGYLPVMLQHAGSLRLAGLLAAVEEFQRSNGRYPESLAEVTTQEQRIDPLTGKEFVYRLMPDGRYELGRLQRDGTTTFVSDPD